MAVNRQGKAAKCKAVNKQGKAAKMHLKKVEHAGPLREDKRSVAVLLKLLQHGLKHPHLGRTLQNCRLRHHVLLQTAVVLAQLRDCEVGVARDLRDHLGAGGVWAECAGVVQVAANGFEELSVEDPPSEQWVVCHLPAARSSQEQPGATVILQPGWSSVRLQSGTALT